MANKSKKKTGEDHGVYEVNIPVGRVPAASEAVTVPNVFTYEQQIGKRYIMIYSDPMTQGLQEGLAQVIKIHKAVALDRGYVMLYATVHFKKDPKWARNERKFMMRG